MSPTEVLELMKKRLSDAVQNVILRQEASVVRIKNTLLKFHMVQPYVVANQINSQRNSHSSIRFKAIAVREGHAKR